MSGVLVKDSRMFSTGKLYAFWCATCAKDTPHRNSLCVYCKTASSTISGARKEAARSAFGERSRRMQAKRKARKAISSMG